MEYTVVLDERLLEEARKALGTGTVQHTIEAGLRAAVQRQREAEFLALLDEIHFDMTEEDLLRLRRADIARLELDDPDGDGGPGVSGADE